RPASVAAAVVESVGNHQTATAPEGVAERRSHGDRLGAGVDGAWSVVEGRREAGDEAPADGAEAAPLPLLHDDDEVLARAEVVARAEIDPRGRLGPELRRQHRGRTGAHDATTHRDRSTGRRRAVHPRGETPSPSPALTAIPRTVRVDRVDLSRPEEDEQCPRASTRSSSW